MAEAILLIVCVPLFIAGCLILASVIRDARQCTVYSVSTNPFSAPCLSPPTAHNGRPHLYVLPPPPASRPRLRLLK